MYVNKSNIAFAKPYRPIKSITNVGWSQLGKLDKLKDMYPDIV